MAWELKVNLPGQPEQIVAIDRNRMLIGTLLSNHVVVRAPDVEPIHAMLEEQDAGGWSIIDLGSAAGVRVNGQRVDVETAIRFGDVIEVADAQISLREAVDVLPIAAGMPPPPPEDIATAVADSVGAPRTAPSPQETQRGTIPSDSERRIERKDILFSPRKAKPSGDVLECVAYWGDTVLDVDLFHPTFKGFETVTIGDTSKAHFIAAGEEDIPRHVFAEIRQDGFKINLLKGMEGRFRKGGSVEENVTSGTHRLGQRDIAHIKYGPIRYFLLFVRPPELNLPRGGPKDPFVLALGTVAAILYLALVPLVWFSTPAPEERELSEDEIAIVNIPEKEKPQPKPVVEKPKIEIADVKQEPVKPPPPKPEPPKPQPVKPVKQEIEKPKPVPSPKPNPQVAQTKSLTPEAPAQPKPPQPKQDPLDNLGKAGQGMPSASKKPDFVAAGPKTGGPIGPAGGEKGGGNTAAGGARKGNQKASVKGVEDVNNNKASGMNLDKLGFASGKVLQKVGPGAIATDFQSSAGGAGGGMGSASKTYGISGSGNKKSLGLSGTDGAVNNFGSGTGGYLSGLGGQGGLGGAGLGRGDGQGGRGRANVYVPPQDPVVAGGLTQQEVADVIRANLNQIRHCYEQLLARSPNSAGKIMAQFVIGLNGMVADASIKSSEIGDQIMQGCVVGKIRRWKFPQPRGGSSVTVTYPFVFNPL